MKEQTTSITNSVPEVTGEMDRLSCLAMAAGKDFNDELTFILNRAESSLKLLGPYHPATSGLRELQQAAWRCAEMSHCLMAKAARSNQPQRYGRVKVIRAYSGN